jgi:dipeptidyl aminopeptidase/acylaminoacyl peptidase
LTTVILPGLRNTTVIPPADFPEPGTGASFFLITQSPTQIVAGEDFTLSIKAFNAQGQPLEEVVSGISLTASPLNLTGTTTGLQTDANGELTLTDAMFEQGGPVDAVITVSATGFDDSNTFTIMVAPTIVVISRNTTGSIGDSSPDPSSSGPGPTLHPANSSDGRYVAFSSYSSNLVPNDTNNQMDVFVVDRETGEIERVSVSSTGGQGSGPSQCPDISGDGRYVTFTSHAQDLVPNDTNGEDCFLHDRRTGTTTRISVDINGDQVDPSNENPVISADGRFVAFSSQGDLLLRGDTNDVVQVYVLEIATGNLEIVSLGTTGDPSTRFCFDLAISGDGRYVSFVSGDQSLTPPINTTSSRRNVYLVDRQQDTITLVSRAFNGGGEVGDGESFEPAISADGRFLVFYSSAVDLVDPPISPQRDNVYFYDIAQDSLSLLSVDENGNRLDANSESRAISGDGRFVVVNTQVLPEIDNQGDLYLYDRQEGTRTLFSTSIAGATGNMVSHQQDISDDGRLISFVSQATNLTPQGNNFMQVFSKLNPNL